MVGSSSSVHPHLPLPTPSNPPCSVPSATCCIKPSAESRTHLCCLHLGPCALSLSNTGTTSCGLRCIYETMAPGQLSPFPSCASGLGFMTTPDCLNASSLLTPTASICTISSLTPGADAEAALSRARAKTMQTKEILKSPQPHRFHLVLSGRRRTPEIPSLPSRPSAQWRDGLGVPVSPGYSDGGGSMELRRTRPDLFSPAASPLMPPADIYTVSTSYNSPRILSSYAAGGRTFLALAWNGGVPG